VNGKSQYKCKQCKKCKTEDNGRIITLFCNKAKKTITSLGFSGNKHYTNSPKWCPFKTMSDVLEKTWRYKKYWKRNGEI